MAINKSDIPGLTYRVKNIGDPAYTGTKRVASNAEKTEISTILSNFLSAVIAKHS
jgi:hypothetical protein